MRASVRRPARRGTALVWVVLSLSVIVGVVALNIDGGRLMEERRRAQVAADAATLAAGAELYKGYWTNFGADPNGTARTAALRAAASNGYPDTAVTVNIPPASGPLAGKAGYAEVVIKTTLSAGFGRIFTGSDLPVTARSVGRGEPLKIGIIALRPTGADAFLNNSLVGVNLNTPVIVNSDDPAAYHEAGLVAVQASRIDITGGYSNTSGVSLNLGKIRTGVTRTLDPLAYLPYPTSTAVRSASKLTINPLLPPLLPTTLQPGVYRGGISISRAANVRLMPGEYIMEGGGFEVGGSATVVGDKVMIYNTTGTAAEGPVWIHGTGIVILTPPTTGQYQGISIFQNRGMTQPVDITAPGLTIITGAVYAAGAKATLSGPVTALVNLGSLGLDLLGLDILDLDVRGGSYVVNSMEVGGLAAVTVKLDVTLDISLPLLQLHLKPNRTRVPDVRVVE